MTRDQDQRSKADLEAAGTELLQSLESAPGFDLGGGLAREFTVRVRWNTRGERAGARQSDGPRIQRGGPVKAIEQAIGKQ